ncbi:hypothetical protein GCM10023194_52330 [Planotetraspora phitsanulokensis]
MELAGRAGVAEVAKAGRFLRAVLDPDGADKESEADHGRRFLRVRPTGSGGLEGEFRLPREAGARLRALLDAYAKPKGEEDDRPLRVRNADAFIALVEQQISTELLVLVNAESLPDDHPAKASPAQPEDADHGTTADAGDSATPSAQTRPGPRRETADSGREREPDAGNTPESGTAPEPGSRATPEPEPEPKEEREPRPGPDNVTGPGLGPDNEPRWKPGPKSQHAAAGWAGLGEQVDRLVPGLLLATGQLLPVREIHRLARTSSLVRLVMDADGQVLDMGRAVRLATKAQRKAAFARYATCWIDGCPLPATMCQIDHADNWSDGGHTDLRLLGPACQFHNRDRYRRPHHYQRRKAGKDRWTFTYTGRTTGPRINHPTRT